MTGYPQDRQKKYGSLPVIIAEVFLVIVGIAVLTSRVPPVIFGIYTVISLMTFVVYALDESAARNVPGEPGKIRCICILWRGAGQEHSLLNSRYAINRESVIPCCFLDDRFVELRCVCMVDNVNRLGRAAVSYWSCSKILITQGQIS